MGLRALAGRAGVQAQGVDAVLEEGRALEAGDDLPEGFTQAVVEPASELAARVVGVDVEDRRADKDGAVDEQQVVGDILRLRGHARHGINDLAEEGVVLTEEDIGIVPDVIAELGFRAATERRPGTQQGDRAARAVDAAVECGAGDGPLQLVAEGIQVGDVLAVEDANFGIALTAEELAERNGELGSTRGTLGPGDHVALVQKLDDVGLPVWYQKGDLGFS